MVGDSDREYFGVLQENIKYSVPNSFDGQLCGKQGMKYFSFVYKERIPCNVKCMDLNCYCMYSYVHPCQHYGTSFVIQ